MNRVLVVGNEGFLGAHLIDWLNRKGVETSGLDNGFGGRFAQAALSEPVHSADIDCRNEGEMARYAQRFRPEVVVFLAGIPQGELCQRDKGLCSTTNMTAVKIAMRVFKPYVSRFIFSSSACVYGDQLMARESGQAEELPRVDSRAKAIAEGYVRAGEIPEKVILRIANAYGPGGQGVLNEWTRALVNGKQIEIHGDGLQSRDFIHVEDVTQILGELALADELSAEAVTYNIGTGTSVTLLDALSTLVELLNPEMPERKRAKELKRLSVEIPVRELDIRRNSVDTGRVHRHYGWRSKVSLVDGLTRLIDWYRSTQVDQLRKTALHREDSFSPCSPCGSNE